MHTGCAWVRVALYAYVWTYGYACMCMCVLRRVAFQAEETKCPAAGRCGALCQERARLNVQSGEGWRVSCGLRLEECEAVTKGGRTGDTGVHGALSLPGWCRWAGGTYTPHHPGLALPPPCPQPQRPPVLSAKLQVEDGCQPTSDVPPAADTALSACGAVCTPTSLPWQQPPGPSGSIHRSEPSSDLCSACPSSDVLLGLCYQALTLPSSEFLNMFSYSLSFLQRVLIFIFISVCRVDLLDPTSSSNTQGQQQATHTAP